MTPTENQRIQDALEVIWQSPIGRAVLLDIKDHSEPSKLTLKRFDQMEEKIEEWAKSFLPTAMFKWIVGIMVGIAITTVGSQWAIMNNYFDIYEANLTDKIEANAEDIKDIKNILSQIEFVNLN